jgi:hypothetical protein
MKNNKNKKEDSSQSDITYVSLTIASLVIALFFMVSLLNSVNNNEDQWPLGVNGFTEYLFGESSTDTKKMDEKTKEFISENKDSIPPVFFKSPLQQEKELSEFVANYKNKFPILSVNSFEYAKNIFYYKKDGYLDVVPNKLYVDNVKDNEEDILKFLKSKQEDFDQESKTVFEEFQTGDAKAKVDLLSTERGKAHLIYRYNGNPGYEHWLNGDYVVLKIYYNPNSESDINTLATSLDSLRKHAKDKGNILRLDLIDINKENAVVLEDIRYSGDVTAVAYPVRITSRYGFFENKEDRHQISLTKNPEYIIELVDYFNKFNMEEFVQKNVIPKKED